MLEAGAIAPDFTLTDGEGRSWKLSEAIHAGPVLLAFFKISCPVCRLTLPFLNRLTGKGLQILGISQDDSKDTRRFQQEVGATLRSLLDPGPGYAASNAWGITIVPSIFRVETDGRISKAFSGFSKTDLESLGVPFGAADEVPALRPG